ncbi:protein FANTASTIC FOUR 2 [Cajanus cajan]|uniref:FAF domain-containing protein n=1 Tax=Cajanus cajan TaxID=3821 RepID=A0A151RKW4_CAJCA|nr:protein FANTASTIC FOUR 2 [Cajanus cajan]KYP43207.1 hypothetical protein KK1_035348 [Cajanus cajan]
MSPSSVCQGLQSCLEPCVMESRVLRLKLALQHGSNFSDPSTVSPLTNHECDKNDTNSSNLGSGWGFLQTLQHTSHCQKKTEDKVYIHPTVKRSSSFLNEKSLEMCTESLGSETGSNASESSDGMSLFSFDTNTCSTKYTTTTDITNATAITVTTSVTSCNSKRVNRACNLPPPLTTITDLGGVQVRPRREGGRLILEAVASPSPRPYFHAERGDGRLRLCLVESFSASDCDDNEEGVDEEEEEEGCENDKKEEAVVEKGCGDLDSGAEEECVENVEDEMEVKMFARPSRCKESGKIDIFVMPWLNCLSLPLFLSVSEYNFVY